MNQTEAIQSHEIGSMAAGEAAINQCEEMESMEIHQQRTVSGTDIRLNEVAAGMLNKTVDTAVAVTQLAVNIPIGVGHITLDSINKLLVGGPEVVNTQFNALINRVFGVRKG